MQPRQTIDSLYAAFARLDAGAMAACYANDAVFEDEVFVLRGKQEVVGMWTMLCTSVKAQGADGWKLEWSAVHAGAHGGTAHWEAWYRFSATGRRCTTASTPSSASTRRAASPSTVTISRSGAGRARPWERRACCSAGHRCCAARCARKPPAICSANWSGSHDLVRGLPGRPARGQRRAGLCAITDCP